MKLLSSIATCLMIGFVLAACSSESEPIETLAAAGPWAIGHTTDTVVDASRDDRELPIDIWYPVDAADVADGDAARYLLAEGFSLESEVAVEDLPVSSRTNQKVIVFSHGYGSLKTQSVELMEALASYGFIVVAVEHIGNSVSDSSDSFDDAAANRVPDISAVIDTMIEHNQDSNGAFFERIDEENFGVAGHSFGGMTAVGVAAGWAGATADSRVVATMPISAVIDGDLQSDDRPSDNAGFTDAQLATITIPTFLLGGTEDLSVPIENNEIAYNGITNASALYRADIIGANHTHFANVCNIGDLLLSIGLDQSTWPGLGAQQLIDPYNRTCTDEAFPIEEANRLTNLYAVAFFKTHLENEEGFDVYLTRRYANQEADVDFWSRITTE